MTPEPIYGHTNDLIEGAKPSGDDSPPRPGCGWVTLCKHLGPENRLHPTAIQLPVENRSAEAIPHPSVVLLKRVEDRLVVVQVDPAR